MNRPSTRSTLSLCLVGIAFLAGCQKEIVTEVVYRDRETTQVPDAATPPDESIGQPTLGNSTDTLQGATRGGGGYVGDLADQYLKEASAELAQFIRQAPPILFNELPDNWSQERLAQVIEQVRSDRERQAKRIDPEHKDQDRKPLTKFLMFDYGTDEKGPFVEAIKPYFDTLGLRDESLETESSKQDTIVEIQLKLLHESSHLFGKNESAARTFSRKLLRAIYNDYIICRPEFESLTIKDNLYVLPFTDFVVSRSTRELRLNFFAKHAVNQTSLQTSRQGEDLQRLLSIAQDHWGFFSSLIRKEGKLTPLRSVTDIDSKRVQHVDMSENGMQIRITPSEHIETSTPSSTGGTALINWNLGTKTTPPSIGEAKVVFPVYDGSSMQHDQYGQLNGGLRPTGETVELKLLCAPAGSANNPQN